MSEEQIEKKQPEVVEITQLEGEGKNKEYPILLKFKKQ